MESVETPVAVFRADTLALGIAPPWASVMVPESVAPATCARIGSDISAPRKRTQPAARILPSFTFINTPPFLLFAFCHLATRTCLRNLREEDTAPRISEATAGL